MMADYPKNNNTQSKTSFKYSRVWLILLIMIGVFIRVHGADGFYYSQDEAMSVRVASADSLKNVLRHSLYETHPPLSFVMEHYWMAFSADPAFVRSLFLLCGIALILLYYQIGYLLNGEATGIICAALITFSHGCIIQSYLVRPYIIFVLFISAAFYHYLAWRISRNTKQLLAYGFFGTLACLSHFSAVFAIGCFLLHEGLEEIYRRVRLRNDTLWLVANLFVIAVAVCLYAIWQPTMKIAAPYFHLYTSVPLWGRLLYALFYTLVTSLYILPPYCECLVIAAFVLIPVFKIYIDKRECNNLRSLITMAWIAMGVGMLLIVTNLYPLAGTRYSIWALPFLVAPAGWIGADCLEMISKRISGKFRSEISHVILLLLFCTGCMIYDPTARFSDRSEYVMPEDQWLGLFSFLSSLSSSDLVVAERDDMVLWQNPDAFLKDRTFIESSMAVEVPYLGTHTLFNPFYRRMLKKDMLLKTLSSAQASAYFKGITKLVFIEIPGPKSRAIDSLMRCTELKEKEFIFSPSSPLNKNAVLVMTVSMEAIERDVIAPEGNAHQCLLDNK